MQAERSARRPGMSATRVSGIVKNFVAQYCNIILYALRDPQPVKADECVCDVVGAFQIEDQPCRCIQNRLESAH